MLPFVARGCRHPCRGDRQLLLGVEADDALNGSLADGAEGLGGVCPHAAILAWAPDAFRLVASAFYKPGNTLVIKVFPFAAEISLRGDVLLPRLGVRVVILNELVVVGIFIGQSTEAVSELVDDNRTEKIVVGGRESVRIVDASAAVSVSVGEDYDVFVRIPARMSCILNRCRVVR